jgi:hypothetical protein
MSLSIFSQAFAASSFEEGLLKDCAYFSDLYWVASPRSVEGKFRECCLLSRGKQGGAPTFAYGPDSAVCPRFSPRLRHRWTFECSAQTWGEVLRSRTRKCV